MFTMLALVRETELMLAASDHPAASQRNPTASVHSPHAAAKRIYIIRRQTWRREPDPHNEGCCGRMISHDDECGGCQAVNLLARDICGDERRFDCRQFRAYVY